MNVVLFLPSYNSDIKFRSDYFLTFDTFYVNEEIECHR